jgi:hypothetical protein
MMARRSSLRPSVPSRGPEIIGGVDHLPSPYDVQALRAAKRAVRFAGAVSPLEYVGMGLTAIVFCDARGHAFKIARRPEDPQTRATLVREAAWLERASHIRELRPHVARFIALHRGAIIERECIRPERAGRGRSRTRLFELFEAINAAMARYGYGKPEFKEDSFVYARGRGWVLVDAGFAVDRGAVLVRRATETIRGRRFFNERPSDLAFDVRMEADETIPSDIAHRLSEQLLALPDAHVRPKRTAARRDRALQ